MRKIYIILFFIFFSISTYANENYSFAFYNVENLYDTLANSNEDLDFTPQGKYLWNTEKYNSKISNIAYAIDEIGADIVALCEIESQQAAIDLVLNLKTDYNYIALYNGDKFSRNMTLLYKGDKFIPNGVHKLNSGTSRGFILVTGKLGGEHINIIIAHMASNFNSNKYRTTNFKALNQHAQVLKNQYTVIMGDFNASPTDKIFKKNMPMGYINPFKELALKSMGSCAYNNQWLMYDNIMVSEKFTMDEKFRFKSNGILIQDKLLNPDTGYPHRSFSQGKFKNGYSDHLPVWIIVERLD